MRKNLLTPTAFFFSVFIALTPPKACARDDKAFEKSDDHAAMIPARLIRKIKLPAGYHEGLFVEKNRIYVNNGEGGKTWVVDMASGELISQIEPAGTFSEGITGAPSGGYWVTDWDAKKLYFVKIENNKMLPESEVSMAPSHPAGVAWDGSHLYVVTWTRGLGTKYHLLKMDKAGNTIRKTAIKNIPEPTQLAWDGKDLWMSSWFNRRVYKIDAETLEIKGYFRSRIDRTSGIAWDGKYFWVTGTEADLRQIEIAH